MHLRNAVRRLEQFQKGAITSRLGSLEMAFRGLAGSKCAPTCAIQEVDLELLESLLLIKKVAGQINVAVHAVGLLLALPALLKHHERIESLSLGAGNTGRKFDLVTSYRIAEFKFIRWRGGAESIRQNALFKDFYNLAESNTRKAKFLYVLGLKHPLTFLNGRRSITSVFSRNNSLLQDFERRYGERFTVVKDYYDYRHRLVRIVDLLDLVPILAKLPSEDIRAA